MLDKIKAVDAISVCLMKEYKKEIYKKSLQLSSAVKIARLNKKDVPSDIVKLIKELDAISRLKNPPIKRK